MAITFQFSTIRYRRQTLLSSLGPWSTLWHFTCQVLSAVAKVTSSVFCSSFRGEDISPFYISSQRLNLPVSLVSSPFYAFFLQRLAFPSNRRTSHAAQKPAVLPLTPSSQSALFIKACSARCFLPPTLLLLEVGFTLANPTISTFISAPGISLAPSLLCRHKAICSVLRLFSRCGWVCSWSTVVFSKLLVRSKPAFRLDLFSFLFRQSTEACIKLVQISANITLAYFSFLFVTVVARHLLHSICLPLFPPPLDIGLTTQQPQPLSALWAFHLPFSSSVSAP